jgi:predicted lipoprotein with Yx(FWY)xxD motif
MLPARHSTHARRTRTTTIAVAVAVAIAVAATAALSACSGSSGSGGSTSTPAASTPAAAAAAAGASTASAGAGAASSDDYGYGATPTAAGTAAASAAAPASMLMVSMQSGGKLGSYLTDADGHTLYVFLKDAPDHSNCAGACLQTWPPLLLGAGQQVEADAAATGTWGSIDTAAGKQVTYNGAPLYHFVKDAQPGDTLGNLLNGLWFVARPDTASTSVLGVRASGPKTPHLVAPTGMTLYTYAKDAAGVSNCSGACLANWPALTVPAGFDPTAVAAASGALGVITRDDGSRQVTYKGLPLYTFAADHQPGDTNGDGVANVWSVAVP